MLEGRVNLGDEGGSYGASGGSAFKATIAAASQARVWTGVRAEIAVPAALGT